MGPGVERATAKDQSYDYRGDLNTPMPAGVLTAGQQSETQSVHSSSSPKHQSVSSDAHLPRRPRHFDSRTRSGGPLESAIKWTTHNRRLRRCIITLKIPCALRRSRPSVKLDRMPRGRLMRRIDHLLRVDSIPSNVILHIPVFTELQFLLPEILSCLDLGYSA